MFSRILSSARNIVPFNKHDEASEKEKKSPGARSLTKQTTEKKSGTPKSTMVTTRRQSGASATLINPDDSNNVPIELLSESAKKRRRTELSKKAATEEETPTKRRKLPVRNKDENSPGVAQSHLAVEMSVGELTGSTEQKELAEKDAIATAVVDAPVAKPKHKKFGDNDPVEVVAAPEPEPERIQDDEDESSDDDAPEEVGAEAAQSKALGAAREAAKAAEQKEAAERQKRKDRDAQLKAQAKAAKKRKHAEEELDESATIENSSITVEPVGRASKPRFDRTTLPDLLPEDFLEDASSEDEAPVQVEKPRVSKKIKFAYEEKKPKDKKLGSTTYRVAQVEKAGFAPKASRNTQSVKANLQGSRKGQVRKPVSSGFVVAKRARA
ncbi:hypothetical protein VE02_00963 [Pseudogymnoascus sp. 03VT05]|nr:hypothetical protein VE02_00963 [Pseudogymnoascus sp. 03VT05]